MLGQLLRQCGIHLELCGNLAVFQEGNELLDPEGLLAFQVAKHFLLEVLVELRTELLLEAVAVKAE